MAPIPNTLMSSGSRKKEAKASHSHKICTEVSSSVPHFLQVGLSLSPITCRCLLRVLCPVSRPITALVCAPLKGISRAPVARSFPVARCGRGVKLTPHPVLVPRSKIEYSYTSTLPKGLRGL